MIPIDDAHCPRDEEVEAFIQHYKSATSQKYDVACLPYNEAVHMLKVTVAQLERMVRHFLRDEAFQGEHTEFYQFSHVMHIVWSRSEQAFRTLTQDGEALYADRLYTVAMQKYHLWM